MAGSPAGDRRDRVQVPDGSPWMDLPERLGSWKGAHNRLRMWAADGTWEWVFTALLAQADADGANDSTDGSPPPPVAHREGPRA
ncbi:transposase [Streptomyces sp. NPDC085540]|uniref:transposase n=1 Tax=Streptomyces sp. NPDC085540 TaxID=3365730 RepID=UPI0037CF8016